VLAQIEEQLIARLTAKQAKQIAAPASEQTVDGKPEHER
jgi:hypothetical protein